MKITIYIAVKQPLGCQSHPRGKTLSDMLHFRAILLLSLLLTSCEGEHYNAPVDQPLFFEYHYINFAWAHQDFGWLIDNEGSIRRFDFPVDYRHGVHGEYLSLEDLEYNLDQTDSIIGTVEAETLVKWLSGLCPDYLY